MLFTASEKVEVLCAGELFYTLADTLKRCFLFEQNWLQWSTILPNGTGMRLTVPTSVCRSARAFQVVLDYLRGPPIWQSFPDEWLLLEVCELCTSLGIGAPPSRQQQGFRQASRVEVKEVALPRAVQGRHSGSLPPSGEPPKASQMFANLSQHGFSIVAEVAKTEATSTGHGGTVVVLQREVAPMPLLQETAVVSTWAAALLQAA
jgi:hypothetical protein